MSLFGVNMAIPVKDSYRESQIYFIHSSDNNNQRNERRKYVIFKILQLILSVCSLPIFAYSVESTGSKIEDMLICAILGALIFYPLLFLLLSISVKQRSACLIAVNLSAFFILLAAVIIIIVTWLLEVKDSFDKEQRKSSALKLTSSVLSIVNGVIYMIESLIMFLEINGHLQPIR